MLSIWGFLWYSTYFISGVKITVSSSSLIYFTSLMFVADLVSFTSSASSSSEFSKLRRVTAESGSLISRSDCLTPL